MHDFSSDLVIFYIRKITNCLKPLKLVQCKFKLEFLHFLEISTCQNAKDNS